MRPPRRAVLSASFLGALMPWRLARAQAAPPAFAAHVDTLAPGAVALGIDGRLFGQAPPPVRRLIDQGCTWLDRQGGQPFAALGVDARERILAAAAAAPPNTLPRVFFDVTRAEVMTLYYSHPASWRALGLAGPPQPDGHPDHARPPG